VIINPKHALGVPNWRDANAYPEAKELTAAQWQWQFLRRRPDYRKAWVDHFDETQQWFDELDAQGLLDDRGRYQEVGSTIRTVCEPFGVSRISAPWLNQPGIHFWQRTFGWATGHLSEHVQIESLVEQNEKREAEGVMLLAFDTNRPFNEQIEAARRHFEARQAERNGNVLKPQRQHKRKWLSYLRAIDARDQGATYADLYIELELAELPAAAYDAELDRNLSALGHQLWQQASDLMFKATS
jgi:hypothetical protein